MTALTKPVTRRTQGEYRVEFHQARRIVVTLLLLPGDVLAVEARAKRKAKR